MCLGGSAYRRRQCCQDLGDAFGGHRDEDGPSFTRESEPTIWNVSDCSLISRIDGQDMSMIQPRGVYQLMLRPSYQGSIS
jgi:hypothetical protein